MAVSLQTLQPLFQASDTNSDGKLNRQELARASLKYLNSSNNQEVGSLFATLLQGGTDRQGLFPDYNTDSAIDFNEFTTLAGKSGDKQSLESDDFKTAFGNRYQAGGQSINLNQLRQLAQPNTNQSGWGNGGFNWPGNYAGYGNGGYGNGGYGQQGSSMFSAMQGMMQLMMTLMQSMFGGGGNRYYA
jgi:Ca2+-binding EF-hand superfamily protein